MVEKAENRAEAQVPPVSQWYVAKTKPRKERLLMGNLASMGINTYFPMIRRADRPGLRLEALFPGYLFCHLDASQSSAPRVRWASGLAYFLGADGRPSPVPDELVLYLQNQTYQWNNESFWLALNAGERIVVTNGPFAGLEGVFQRHIPSRERCRVLLDTLSGIVAAELPASQVRVAAVLRPLAL